MHTPSARSPWAHLLTLAVCSGLVAVAFPVEAVAHTETDYVAVAAGAETTVVLRPTHGCGAAATVHVATRVPVPDASGGPVVGWEVTSAPDGEGRTVIEWHGGPLPTGEAGAFPVTFTTPADVGALVLIPFVQTCENGEELAWISGDPSGEFPAPRLLVLPTGMPPAATLDDVPADAPGRDQLVVVVDIDNPSGSPETTTTTPTPAASPTAGPVPTDTTGLASAIPESPEAPTRGAAGWVVAGGLVAVLAAGLVAVGVRRSRPSQTH